MIKKDKTEDENGKDENNNNDYKVLMLKIPSLTHLGKKFLSKAHPL